VNNFSVTASSIGSLELEAKDGAYMFLQPTKYEDFDFIDTYDTNTLSILDSYFELDHSASWNVAYLSGLPTAANGRSFLLNICWSLEYQTTDIWRDVERVASNEKAWTLALDKLKECPQFHSNVNHFKEIVDKIGNGIMTGLKGFIKFAPPIAALARSAMTVMGAL